MRFGARTSLFVAAVAAVWAVGAAPAAAQTAVKIGAALSMTGPAAVYGATQKAGIQAGVDEINRKGGLKDLKLEAVIEELRTAVEADFARLIRFD